MASIINASTSPAGLIQSSDGSAVLTLQSSGTNAIHINESQVVTVNNDLVVSGNANIANVTSDLTVSGNVTVTTDLSVSSNLDVTDTISVSNLDVTDTISVSNLNVSGTITGSLVVDSLSDLGAGANTFLTSPSVSTLPVSLSGNGTSIMTNQYSSASLVTLSTVKIKFPYEDGSNLASTVLDADEDFEIRGFVNGSIYYYPLNPTANWTWDLTGWGFSGYRLNDFLGIGEVATFVAMVNQGATPYYMSALKVDGNAVTPKWQGGLAPSAGNANSIDVYTFSVFKTADATFNVFASLTQFA